MRKILKRNAFYSLLNVFVTGGMYFVLYKHLLTTLGVDLLGVWSLVMVTVSAAKISDMGFAGSVVKFVAKNAATNNYASAAGIVETSFLSVAGIVTVIAILAYYPLQWLLAIILAPDELEYALTLLPYALVGLCINTASGIFLSGLDGCQRIDVRNVILMSSAVIFLVAVMGMLPRYGFVALAYAQVMQSIILLLASWIMLRRVLPEIRVLMRWSPGYFREIWRYAAVFQLTALVALSYEPVTKSLLSYFGGVSSVGFYEMANRMVMQIRALIVNINQIFVPAVANILESEPARLKSIYSRAYELVFVATLMLFVPFMATTPVISEVWAGYYESEFVLYAMLLLGGWMINTLSSLAFFFNQGLGSLRPNLAGHALIAVLNVILCVFLGSVYGSVGVVSAWVVSLIAGSLMIQMKYSARHNISLVQQIPAGSAGLMAFVSVGAVLSGALYHVSGVNEYVLLLMSAAVYIIFAAIGLLKTVSGRKLVREITSA